VTGEFEGIVDFDPGDDKKDEYTSNGFEDVFLSKFDSSGDFKWARTWGGIHSDYGRGVAVDDSSGNVYVTGDFKDTVDFDLGSGMDYRTSNGGSDVFLNRFLPDGSW
jgi:hypothetical protein